MRIQVVSHDPTWKAGFFTEARHICLALDDLVLTIHHIGSTAIPGIPAKPIIDILLEVTDVDELDRKSAAMESLGYEVMGEFGLPRRRYFRKDNSAGVRTHQVHAWRTGDKSIQRHLAFRDYMIAHPEAAQEYGVLKQNIAKAHPDDIYAYMDGKDAFVKEHEAKALEWWTE